MAYLLLLEQVVVDAKVTSLIPVFSNWSAQLMTAFTKKCYSVQITFLRTCSIVMLNCITRIRSSSIIFLVNNGTSGLWSVCTFTVGNPMF